MTSSEKSKVLGHSVLLNDVYYAAEIEEVSYVYKVCTLLPVVYVLIMVLSCRHLSVFVQKGYVFSIWTFFTSNTVLHIICLFLYHCFNVGFMFVFIVIVFMYIWLQCFVKSVYICITCITLSLLWYISGP